jgi:hypothetical protein
MLGQTADAIDAFERVLELESNYIQAQERINRLQNSSIPDRDDSVV